MPAFAVCYQRDAGAPFLHRQLAETFDVGAHLEGRAPFHGRFGIKQGGDLAADGGSGLEDLGGLRQRHTGPVLPQGSGVLLALKRRLQHGNDVKEQVLRRFAG